jgi:hypothetical protein
MRYMLNLLFVVALLLSVGSAIPAQAVGQSPKRGEGTTESRKLLEEVLMARLTRELALDESQTVLMVRHMAEYRDRMLALRRERGEKMRALRQAVREGDDEAGIEALMEEVLALNQKVASARNSFLDFQGFELTIWQQARLVVFLNDFEGDMRRLLHRARERRGNGPGGVQNRGARGVEGSQSETEKATPGGKEAGSEALTK